MPYTAKQNKLFRAAEHDPAIAKRVGISQSTAKRLAHEGVHRAPIKPKTMQHKPSSRLGVKGY